MGRWRRGRGSLGGALVYEAESDPSLVGFVVAGLIYGAIAAVLLRATYAVVIERAHVRVTSDDASEGFDVRDRTLGDADGWHHGVMQVGPQEASCYPRWLWQRAEPITWSRDGTTIEGQRRPSAAESLLSIHPRCVVYETDHI